MGGNVFGRRGVLMLGAAACAVIVVGAAGPAQAGAGTSHLGAGESLSANQSLRSGNGSYTTGRDARSGSGWAGMGPERLSKRENPHPAPIME